MTRLCSFLYLLASAALCSHMASATVVTASYYDLPGKVMADGEIYNPADPSLAAASQCLFGKRLLVTNPQNGRSIVVSVQDRMPGNMCRKHIDLSVEGAIELGFIEKGTTLVEIQELRR